MKTYYFTRKRLSIYALFGFLTIFISSCGSYQNSSYYDNDGVYGNSQSNRKEVTTNNSQSNKYQEYFSDLNKDSQSFLRSQRLRRISLEIHGKSWNSCEKGNDCRPPGKFCVQWNLFCDSMR